MRKYTGQTDDGRRFVILYTRDGVCWRWGEDADRVTGPPPATSEPVNELAARSRTVNEALNSAAGVVGAAAQLVGSVARILEWWETRQVRLLDEAKFEEERRIPWTYDMMHRWVGAHREGTHLDLEISHYLGRETAATLVALGVNKKMAVPQAMLYELEQIRSAISAARVLLGRQFDALEKAQDFNISAFATSAFRGDSIGSFVVNFDAIRRWSGDPAVDWEDCVARNSVKSFESEFRDLQRYPKKLMATAFGYVVPGREEDNGKFSLPDVTSPFWTSLALAGLRSANPLVPLALGIVPAAAIAVFEQIKEADAFRRDDFKELALVTAEIERVRILHRLWCVLDGAVRVARGGGLLVQEMEGDLILSAPQENKEWKVISRHSLMAP